MTTYRETGQLIPSAPFDFAKSLGFVSGFMPTQHEQTITDQALTKAVIVNGQCVVFSVGSAGSVDEPRLEYVLYNAEPITPILKAAALDRIRFYLSLDDNLQPFYALAQNDATFRPVVSRMYGQHQVKFLTPFENACWAILTQRTPIPIARKMKLTLVERYGASLEVEGMNYSAFPDPAGLAAIDPYELTMLIHNGRKAECLSAAAHAFSKVDENFLRTGNYAEVVEWLHNIKGIGDWSASFILIRGLGRMDHISGEKQLAEAVHRVYGSHCTIEDIAAQYGAWQGYWAYYMRNAA